MEGLTIAHVIPYIGRAQGGPVVSLSVLASAQAAAGHRVSVFCAPRPSDGPEMPFGPAVEVRRARACGGAFRWCPSLEREFEACPARVVHSHGLWTDVHRRAAAWARRRRVPHVIAPCGMLDAAALRRAWWKKAPAWAVFQRRALRGAAALQAKSEQEYGDIRRAKLAAPVAMIPNPVPPAPAGGWSARRFRESHGLDGDHRIVLYLGRIHPVKGVMELARAWTELHAAHPEWRLVMAGPDEGGHRSETANALEAAGCGGSYVFTGMLSDEQKAGAFAASELFVMPSRFENFGVAIAEALAAGLPVVTTRGTPWRRLVDQQAGWWVDPSSEELGRALKRAMSLPTERLAEMGRRARRIASEFEPRQICSRVLGLYRELLDAPGQACVPGSRGFGARLPPGAVA